MRSSVTAISVNTEAPVMNGYRKIKSLALVAGLFAFGQALSVFAAEDDCKPQQIDLVKKVALIYDGNSFLIDNDYVTLTGVYVPSPGRTNSPEETGGKAATAAVSELIKKFDGKIGLELDALTNIKSRVIAHVYLPNGKNLAEHLLENGLALVNTELPNTRHLQCYRDAEERARNAKKGLWQFQDKGIPVLESKNLTGSDDSFHVVRGKVVFVKEGEGYYLLNMDTLGVRIHNDELHRFMIKDLNALMGKTIEVRGNLKFYEGHMFVRIHHPGQIDLLADKFQPNKAKK